MIRTIDIQHADTQQAQALNKPATPDMQVQCCLHCLDMPLWLNSYSTPLLSTYAIKAYSALQAESPIAG
jgi:hypothetical protein